MKVAGLWAIGITIFIGIGVAAYAYNKKQEAASTQNADPIENYDDVGSDVVITVEDDTPVVIVGDDSTEVTVID